MVKVGDVLRVPAFSGGYRVWQVAAVLLGAENQESAYELRTLDRDSHDRPLVVPVELAESRNLEIL